LPSASFFVAFAYEHPFYRNTTATNYDNFGYTREDTEGHSGLSADLNGAMLTNHQFNWTVDAALDITPKLSLDLTMIMLNKWKYKPSDGVAINTGAGDVNVPRGSDAPLFAQQTWFVASLDYKLFDELELGVGYYNLANIIAPDGQRRGVFGGDNIWWSPDARVFFDITANLDKIYQRIAGVKKPEEPKATANAAQQARVQRVMQQSEMTH
jgi:hypothetical protein